MKRNLLQGIILISAIALSSCSTLNTISKSENTGDDVYYTKAKAGDDYEYVPEYTQQPTNTVRNDDYYYYGDYESRIKRFSYFTPFDYDDDFYYSYTPYNYYSPQPTVTADANIGYAYGYDPYAYDFGTYSAYDFGYGDYSGYDNFGYGFAYSTFIYGGGGRTSHKKSYSHSNNNVVGSGGLTFTRANGGSNRSNTSNGSGLTFARANANSNGNGAAYSGSRPGGTNAVYPGRPGANSVTTVPTNTTTRYIRPQSENPRPVIQQPTMERASPPAQSTSSSSNSSSSGSSNSSGGGGRPVRP
ncbi:MAG: hypothetical protein JWQ34_927 [Mucilaginibacter sp.]|uniref:hypothetical protein n=1 Tax=Mucilaginibacter sp. TaxID=1882438 RepID=UPI002618BDCC|nr:hypothetical protein [Mucilaginibacter sp.]MDB5002702.1 hypothetical protein [Mucilaginibacter sp.]